MNASPLSRSVARLVLLLTFLAAAVGAVRAQNVVLPYISISSPINGQFITTAPTNVNIRVVAYDTNTIQTVQYFANDTSIGIVSNTNGVPTTNTSPDNPFKFTWNNVPMGYYHLKAVATDIAGLVATSGPISITVTSYPPVIVRPAVYIYSPTNGSYFLGPTNLNLYARATQTTGTVQTVEFRANGASLGIVPNSSQIVVSNISSVPLFPLAWSNVPLGNFELTAIATSGSSITATSTVVHISVVTNLPTPPVIPFTVKLLHPENNQVFTPAPYPVFIQAGVSDSNLVTTVEFFANDASLGRATNSHGLMFSTNSNSSNPFYLTWTNAPAGSYVLKAVATDNFGQMVTSTPISITVTSPPPPVLPYLVSITTPANHQIISFAPTNVMLHVVVIDSNIVQSVQYFANDLNIGTVSNLANVPTTNTSSSSLFNFLWTNVTAGAYSLRAIAFDAAGYSATSAPISITVTSVPPVIVRPSVYIYSPTNTSLFLGPTNLNLYAHAVEGTNPIATVEFRANGSSLGVVSGASQVVVSNISTALLFPLTWSNVLAGAYELTAIATDATGNSATSTVVHITVVTNIPSPQIPFLVSLYAPTNHQVFSPAPASIYVHAAVVDSNAITTLEYFANDTSIGVVTNSGGLIFTNTTSGNPFFLLWSNVLAGSYTLRAVATDTAGFMATSAPISITVTSVPPVIVRPSVYIYSPTNNSLFLGPTNLNLYARAVEGNTGTVQTVEFRANGVSLGVVSNGSQVIVSNISSVPLFPLAWLDVQPGLYEVAAIATDAFGNSATSTVVHLSVVTNLPAKPPIPFSIVLTSPVNHQQYHAPANVYLHAVVVDSNLITSVRFSANDTPIGTVTNTGNFMFTNEATANPFYLVWSNAPVGNYNLRAAATDNTGASVTSAPVSIVISNVITLPPTNIPVVNIYAPDPVAVEGTNCPYAGSSETNANDLTGPNTATFVVSRNGPTNASLTVPYHIAGTATNGVDYATISGSVTIPAGEHYAKIIIVPLDDSDPTNHDRETVVLELSAPPTTNNVPPYSVGQSHRAAAIIVDSCDLPFVLPTAHNLPGHVVHVSLPAPDGLNFILQVSTNWIDWNTLCTNTVFKGSAQFVDPDGDQNNARYYRVVPADAAPNY